MDRTLGVKIMIMLGFMESIYSGRLINSGFVALVYTISGWQYILNGRKTDVTGM